MKILHTSDWHIGRLLNDYSLLEDQRFLLERLYGLIEENGVEVLLISGDLFDRRVPSAQAVKLLDEVFFHLVAKMKIKVLAIGGNHDSPERLSFASRLYRESGLYMESVFDGNVRKVTLEDEFGEVCFHLLPYTDPYALRRLYGDTVPPGDNAVFQETARRIVEGMDKSKRNILLAHGFFGWISREGEQQNELVLSNSEINVGGSEMADLSTLQDFDYIALGHLHAPQKVWRDTVRYSGSLLKYSTSEANQRKSAVLLDLKEKGNLSFSLLPLVPMRDVRVIVGSLEELSCYEERADNQDYVFAKLTDDHLVTDAMAKLKSVYPNALGLTLSALDDSAQLHLRGGMQRAQKSETDLFADFYAAVTGGELSEEERDFVLGLAHQAKEAGLEI